MMLKTNRCGLIVGVIAAAALFSESLLLADDGSTAKNGGSAVSVSLLIQDLNSDSQPKRIAAIDRLGSMGPKAAAGESGAVEALQKQLKLKSSSAMVQAHAAHALGQIGAAARPAAEALVSLVGSSDETVRREAVRALAKIKPGAKLVLPILARLLGDASPAVRTNALQALTEFGEPAVPLLIKALDDEKTDYWAMLVLAELGPQAKAAVPALIKKLSSQQPEIRHEALIALGKIGPAAAPAVGEWPTRWSNARIFPSCSVRWAAPR